MEEKVVMGMSMTDHTRAERLTGNDLMSHTEANRRQRSPATQRTGQIRRRADEPHTDDQRLALIVVLLAGLFLLGVGAGWQPAEPDRRAVSTAPVTDTQAADVKETALRNTSGLTQTPDLR